MNALELVPLTALIVYNNLSPDTTYDVSYPNLIATKFSASFYTCYAFQITNCFYFLYQPFRFGETL